MNQVIFQELFADMAEKFGIAKLCRDNNKDYDLQSMMIAMSGKICNQEPIDEDKLDELANESSMFLEDGSANGTIRANNYELGFKAGYRKAMGE